MGTIEQILERRPVVLQILRFIAIGALNTTLDFIIFNLLSKSLNIYAGRELGFLTIVGFTAAMVQSYFWNRYWTFGKAGDMKMSPVTEFIRLMMVGGLGAVTFVAVLIGAKYEVYPSYYLITLAIFLGVEMMLWLLYELKKKADSHANHFMAFVIVSIIGLLINAAIVGLMSSYLSGTRFGLNLDLLKNEAKIVATLASLIWNFVGYKLFVFRNNQ